MAQRKYVDDYTDPTPDEAAAAQAAAAQNDNAATPPAAITAPQTAAPTDVPAAPYAPASSGLGLIKYIDDAPKPPDKYMQAAIEAQAQARQNALAEIAKRGGDPSQLDAPDHIGGFIQGYGQGWGDEVLGAMSAPFAMAKYGTWNPVEGYKYGKAAMDLAFQNVEKSNPGWHGITLDNLLGTAVSGGQILKAGRGLLGLGEAAPEAINGARTWGEATKDLALNVGKGGLSGAAWGAASGLGQGDTWDERLQNAWTGTKTGALIGAAAPIALQAGRSLWGAGKGAYNYAQSRFGSGPENEAAYVRDKLAGIVAENEAAASGKGGSTFFQQRPTSAPAEAAPPSAGAPPSQAPTAMPPLPKYVEPPAAQPEPAPQTAPYSKGYSDVPFFNIDDIPEGVGGSISRNPPGFGFGSPADAGEPRDRIADAIARTERANKAGQTLFTVGDALGNPAQRAVSGAYQYAGPGREFADDFIAGRTLELPQQTGAAMRRFMDTKETAAQLEKRMRLEASTEARPLYQQSIAKPIPYDAVAPYLELEDAQKYIDRGAKLQAERTVGQPPGEYPPDPTMEKVHHLVVGLNERIDNGTAINGVMNPDAEAANAWKHHLLNVVDPLNPLYKTARATYAEPHQVREAIGMGQQAARSGLSQDQIPEYNALTDREKQAYRTGYIEPGLEKLENQGIFPGYWRQKSGKMQLLKVLAHNNADAMTEWLQNHEDMLTTHQKVVGGSPTAGKLMDAQNVMSLDNLHDMVDAGHAIASGDAFKALGIVKSIPGKMGASSPQRDALVRTLLSTGRPEEIEQFRNILGLGSTPNAP